MKSYAAFTVFQQAVRFPAGFGCHCIHRIIEGNDVKILYFSIRIMPNGKNLFSLTNIIKRINVFSVL